MLININMDQLSGSSGGLWKPVTRHLPAALQSLAANRRRPSFAAVISMSKLASPFVAPLEHSVKPAEVFSRYSFLTAEFW